jgi:primosomal protein N' (replication factor Y)
METPLYAVVAVDMSTRQKLGMIARAVEEAEQAGIRIEDNPLFTAYHYSIPQELSEQLVPGQLVWVPFGNEHRQGVLLGFADDAPVQRVRPLLAIAHAEPFLQPYQLELARWLSHRYLAPLWDTLVLMLPPGVMQSAERVLRRSPRDVTQPLARDARKVLAWVESQEGVSTQKEITGVLGSERRARQVVADLLREGLLRDEMVAKPPGVRPRTERFVSLVPGADRSRLRHLGRPSKQADMVEQLAAHGGEMDLSALLDATEAKETLARGLEEKRLVEIIPGTYVQRRFAAEEQTGTLSQAQQEALSWLDSWPADEPLTLSTVLASGIRAPTLQALATRGHAHIHEVEPDKARLLVPSYRVNATLDEMRGNETYRAVLDFLSRNVTEMTVAEIYEATGAESRHLDALADQGLITIESREVLRNPLANRVIRPTEPPDFTPEQAAVWAEVERAIAGNGPGQVFLLHGVTGSGKTEIYLRAVAETLARGKQAAVMVPEIALTPQTIARFGARFGELIALQHSQLSEGERYDEWRRLRDGRAQVAIGSRSAIFAPLPNLGLIVMDEEHEWTYKQGHLPGYRFPQYHARDVAEKLAALTGAMVILGSATPAIESYHRAEQGRYRLLEMGQRVLPQLTPAAPVLSLPDDLDEEGYGAAGSLSPVQIVDMRQELRSGNRNILSRDLQRALRVTLAARQQAILFLNRRGAHSFVMCRDCGWVQKCTHCDVPMSSHLALDYLICHQCSATGAIPHHCPQCLSPRVKHFGVGTQQVEQVAQELFPDARILRWDRDTARGKGAHERLLARFASGQADILIGTQMIAKGLDLPLVTLVGIISADTALHLPDFRSAERTFGLLTQVAGRAGRSALGGKVVLQTYTPLHYAIQCASRHDFHDFYRYELGFRREHAYPPFASLVKLVFSDPAPRVAEEQAANMAERLRIRCAQLGLPATEIIGPAPAYFGKLRGKYRWQLLVRGSHARDLIRETPPGFGWEVDVDPASVL